MMPGPMQILILLVGFLLIAHLPLMIIAIVLVSTKYPDEKKTGAILLSIFAPVVGPIIALAGLNKVQRPPQPPPVSPPGDDSHNR